MHRVGLPQRPPTGSERMRREKGALRVLKWRRRPPVTAHLARTSRWNERMRPQCDPYRTPIGPRQLSWGLIHPAGLECAGPERCCLRRSNGWGEVQGWPLRSRTARSGQHEALALGLRHGSSERGRPGRCAATDPNGRHPQKGRSSARDADPTQREGRSSRTSGSVRASKLKAP